MKITNANLSGTGIQHANLSHAVIDHVHLYGTEFLNIVLPQEGDGNFNPDGQYKPIIFRNSNLSNMEIIDCDISGLKINGILIEELLRDKEGGRQ
ncbi:pentapeptide repeat-containing protein [Cohnella silvisoli]|uniref:pentapeptide repeat-containing protein n=1 Tax=Cohnella silvisoli TaxID=2873699 RepID=UPI0032DA854B